MLHSRPVHLIRKSGGKILTLLSFFDHMTATKKNEIIAPHKIVIGSNVDLCIYVTFKEAKLQDYSLRVVRELESLNYQVIHINNDVTEKNPYQSPIEFSFQRRNYGHDLAAFKDTLNLLEGKPKSLLLLNSSMFYLPGGIQSLVERAGRSAGDVIGITQSMQTRDHIQSYFFYSKTKEGIDALFSTYSQMRNWKTKRAAVFFGELRIKGVIESFGATTNVLVSYNEIVASALSLPKFVDDWVYKKLKRGIYLNPTQHLWCLLFELGIPALKNNLMNINPARIKFRPRDPLEAAKLYYSIFQDRNWR
jgi:hypothetical protein